MRTPNHEFPESHTIRCVCPGSKSNRPVFFAEIGWYSSGEVQSSSSGEKQAAFIRRLPEFLGGLEVEAVCWISLCDLKQLPELKALEQKLPQFFSLALLDSGLRPKPAWEAWLSLGAPGKGVRPGAVVLPDGEKP